MNICQLFTWISDFLKELFGYKKKENSQIHLLWFLDTNNFFKKSCNSKKHQKSK